MHLDGDKLAFHINIAETGFINETAQFVGRAFVYFAAKIGKINLGFLWFAHIILSYLQNVGMILLLGYSLRSSFVNMTQTIKMHEPLVTRAE